MKIQALHKLRWAGLLLIVGVLFMPAIAKAAAENGGIGGKPANPRNDNPRTQSIFVYELQPDQKAADAVEIFNNTETEKRIKVYATDSVISSGGAFACAQAADTVKDVGGWISLQKDIVTLQPGASEKINFTVSVPDFAEPGEHNGCIAIQEADAEAASVGNGIALSFRSAIRVAITVPGDIKKDLTIRDVRLTSRDTVLIGTVLMRNNGNVSLDTTITSSLKGLFGGARQTITGTYPALPQTLTELNFEYNKPYWGGIYKIDVRAQYNSNIAESLGEGSAQQEVQKSSKYMYIVPEPTALAVQLAIVSTVCVLGWLAWRKMIIQKRQIKKWVDYEVRKGDDVQSLAASIDANWKHIVVANKIRAPYMLKEGETIKLPISPPQLKEPTSKSKKKPVKKSTKKTTKKPTTKKSAKRPKKTAKKEE